MNHPSFFKWTAHALTLSLIVGTPMAALAAVSVHQTDYNQVATQNDITRLQTQGLNNQYLSSFQISHTTYQGSLDELNDIFTQPQYVEVRVNDNGAALTEDLLPQVVSE